MAIGAPTVSTPYCLRYLVPLTSDAGAEASDTRAAADMVTDAKQQMREFLRLISSDDEGSGDDDWVNAPQRNPKISLYALSLDTALLAVSAEFTEVEETKTLTVRAASTNGGTIAGNVLVEIRLNHSIER